jgi:hypothetical protein
LASRRGPVVVGSATAAAALAAVAIGYYILFVNEGLAGAAPAIVQAVDGTSRPGARAARLAVNNEMTTEQAGAVNSQDIARQGPRNSISKQADDWGVRTCLDQIGQVSDFLTTGQAYTALSRRGPTSSDGNAFSATIAGTDADGLASISSFVSAPVATEKCNSLYQTVAAFPGNCEQVRAARFQSFTNRVDMGAASQAWSNGNGAYLHMLSQGDRGCVIVKTEMIF